MLHHPVDASYFTYNTFFSHVKAHWDSNVQCIDIRIGRLNYDGWIFFKFYINTYLRDGPFNFQVGGYGFFSKKNIRISNVAGKNILILVEEKKLI